MNVDITNHLVPWTQVKEMLKQAKRDAWDEGYGIGGNDAGSGWRTEELTPNPYQEDA